MAAAPCFPDKPSILWSFPKAFFPAATAPELTRQIFFAHFVQFGNLPDQVFKHGKGKSVFVSQDSRTDFDNDAFCVLQGGIFGYHGQSVRNTLQFQEILHFQAVRLPDNE